MITTDAKLQAKIESEASIFQDEDDSEEMWKDSLSFKHGANLLAPLLLQMKSALKCNETFHRLGGIDDCDQCLALKAYEIFMGNVNE